jgi:aryl-alcohol dehydrogenase-like predicted oxidoreductase
VEYRQLGRSGLRVSAIAFGTNTFGGRGIFSQLGSTEGAAARRLIDTCIDAGVNLFDTADEYSAGRSEEILGQSLTGKRDRALIATKARTPTGPGPNDAGLSRLHLLRACEASLRRLRTDYIDLYQVHAWDGQTPLEETLDALDHLVRSGKVRYIGACNYSAWHLMKALGVSARYGYQRFACHHIHYSLQAREVEYELIPAAVDQELGTLVWSPLAGGLLSGKYRRGQPPPPGSRHAGNWAEPPIRDWEALYDLIEVLLDLGQERGASPAQVALAWLLGRPGVTSVVVGARAPQQLEDNLGACDLSLAPEERQRLDAASAPALIYPYWHQAKIASDRLSAADLVLLGGYVDRDMTDASTHPAQIP